MSQDQLSSRKEKKSRRDEERKRFKSSRKPADQSKVGDQREEAQADIHTLNDESKPDKRDADQSLPASTSRKRKAETEELDDTHLEIDVSKKGAKKRKKAQIETAHTNEDTTQDAKSQDSKPLKSRFIVFVGNLPYSTTDESLQTYFKKLAPFTLRHRTDPKTKKSKGFAFLEFENYDRMKTCLKLYHHSMFDPRKAVPYDGDGGSQASEQKPGKNDKSARRINVELTAGGGGKSEFRAEKLKTKNARLDEQRKRRAELERKENAKKTRPGKANGTGDNDASVQPSTTTEESAAIHPSRLARIHA